MAGKCKACGKPLTDPVSRRRGMGDACAVKEAQVTAASDDELEMQLERLLAESPDSTVIARELEQVRAIRFRQPDNGLAIRNLIEWHRGVGRQYEPIPEHLAGVADAIDCYIQRPERTPIRYLNRHGYPVETGRDALRLIAQLATVIPEVLAIVEVRVPITEALAQAAPATEETGAGRWLQ